MNHPERQRSSPFRYFVQPAKRHQPINAALLIANASPFRPSPTRRLSPSKIPHQKVRGDISSRKIRPINHQSSANASAPSSLCRNARVRVVKDPPAHHSRCRTTRPIRTLARRPYVPIRPDPDCARLRADDETMAEIPQDPHHPVVAQGRLPREGVQRAHRARQEQGPAHQGPGAPADQGAQDHEYVESWTPRLRDGMDADSFGQPARRPAVRVPRRGIATRCASTSGLSSMLTPGPSQQQPSLAL